jgi:ribose transport system ATP-binding protein
VYVFYRGRVIREMSGAEITPDALIAAALNAHSRIAAQ